MNLKKFLLAISMVLIFTFAAVAPRQAHAEDFGPWAKGGTNPWAGSWTRNEPQADPWTLQPWCLQHVGCGQYKIRNRTDSWVQIYLTRGDTLETGFFTIAPGSNNAITLIPWLYQATYVYWCNGEMQTLTTLWNISGNWTDIFRCPGGPVRSRR